MVPHGCYRVLQVPTLLGRLASVDAISCDAPGLTMNMPKSGVSGNFSGHG